MQMICWFISSLLAGRLYVQTFYSLCVGAVSAELLAAAETDAHREMGKTEGGQCKSLRRPCGGSGEEG